MRDMAAGKQFWTIAVALSLACSSANSTPSYIPEREYEAQCAAIFGILWKVYSTNDGTESEFDKIKEDKYKEKHEQLVDLVKIKYAKEIDESIELIQIYIDKFVAIPSDKANLLLDLAHTCESKF